MQKSDVIDDGTRDIDNVTRLDAIDDLILFWCIRKADNPNALFNIPVNATQAGIYTIEVTFFEIAKEPNGGCGREAYYERARCIR